MDVAGILQVEAGAPLPVVNFLRGLWNFFSRNNWRLRWWLLVIVGSISLSVGVCLTFITLRNRSFSKNPVEVCLIWRWFFPYFWKDSGVVELTHPSEDYTAFISFFAAGCLVLGGFHLSLILWSGKILKHKIVTEELTPLKTLLGFLLSTLFSTAPNAFKKHGMESFYVALPLMVWAFTVQFFLQAKSESVFFACACSSLFTVLTALVPCRPEGPSDLVIWIVSVLLAHFLCYYYARMTYDPEKGKIRIRIRAEAPYLAQNQTLRLVRLPQDEFDELVNADRISEIFFLEDSNPQAQGNDERVFQLISYGPEDDDLRDALLASDEVQYVTHCYTLKIVNEAA